MRSYIESHLQNKLNSSLSSFDLFVFNIFLKFFIPFNGAHGFKIIEMKKGYAKITLPFKRSNFNHLRGLHAAALVTLGEYCAGMNLLSVLGLKEYRFILQELSAKYHYQGRMAVWGHCEMDIAAQKILIDEVKAQGKTLVTLNTEIYDTKGQHIATITTTWQAKDWRTVRTK
jgi:acyl-coenzyme A thioesterase PaaI-like protein